MESIIIDTNVLVRFFIKDLESQFKQAQELVEKIEKRKAKGLLSILVINELIWILENYYNLKKEQYLPELLNLLALKNIKIIEIKKALLANILEQMQNYKIDFTDIYLFNIISEKQKIFTFDKDFEKLKKH